MLVINLLQLQALKGQEQNSKKKSLNTEERNTVYVKENIKINGEKI